MRALAIVLLAAGTALAQETKKGPAVEGTIANEKPGAVLKLKGTLARWPDHAFAYVKLFVKDGPDIDWYKMEVVNGAYEGTFAFGTRKTAPMVYRAELWLRVGQQSAGVKQRFMTDLGVPKDHSEVVDKCDVSSGSTDEQRKFRKETLGKCDEWLKRARSASEKAAAAIEGAAKTPSWDAEKKKIDEETTKLQGDYLACEKEWVTLGREALRLKEVKDVVVTIFKVLEDAKDDADAARESAEKGKAALEKASSSIETTKSELSSDKKDEK